jgi:hypothetical protein
VPHGPKPLPAHILSKSTVKAVTRRYIICDIENVVRDHKYIHRGGMNGSQLHTARGVGGKEENRESEKEDE